MGADTVTAMTDPLALAAAGVGKELEPAVEEFAKQVGGLAGAETGGLFADHIRYKRWKAQVRILTKAQRYAEKKGFTPQEVPLKTLAPLIEQGSLEDEEDEPMTDRWAALLANAADPESDVPNSFPRLLGEMTSTDARLLDVIAGDLEPVPTSHRLTNGKVISMLPTLLEDISIEEVELSLANLYRLGLVSPPASGLAFTDHPEHKFLVSGGVDLVCRTVLGDAFVQACRPPA